LHKCKKTKLASVVDKICPRCICELGIKQERKKERKKERRNKDRKKGKGK
jgi:hypothetical protein